ncbi:MAG: ribonuclease HII [Pseudobdellovibrio sp.]
MSNNISFDLVKINKLPRPHIGIDEVGRGCLAGPVCAGVVILDEKNPFDHYQDSKSLSEENRHVLSEDIKNNHYWALGWASVVEVDNINIRQATFLAMSRAIESLVVKYDLKKEGTLLIDGRDVVPNIKSFEQLAIVKGDQHLRSISAASIIAKVARDELMRTIAQEFPYYGFEKHKGYGTELHREAIAKFKPTIHHRKTFGGVKEYIST